MIKFKDLTAILCGLERNKEATIIRSIGNSWLRLTGRIMSRLQIVTHCGHRRGRRTKRHNKRSTCKTIYPDVLYWLRLASVRYLNECRKPDISIAMKRLWSCGRHLRQVISLSSNCWNGAWNEPWINNIRRLPHKDLTAILYGLERNKEAT